MLSSCITWLRFELQGHFILLPVGTLLAYLYMSWPSEHLFASSELQRVTPPHTFARGQVREDAITVYYPVGIRLSVFFVCVFLTVHHSIDLFQLPN